ncbi:MAG TPA: DUF4926 domain-containing protein [Pyrinomonadaceae bacterium]|nr:DUF4926 domain-containing protein [Pyrinomonadaceae bacterium]
MQQIKENDLVALLVDLPGEGLWRGDVGTVIEVFRQNEHHPGGYLVEFVAETGAVFAHASITDESQLVQLRFRREAA